MFKATCANCGNECEVPFKPNGSRPIYCRDCFKKEDSFGGNRSDGPVVRTSFPDRPMFQATCASCGGRCEVPFRPSGDKPIYCKACFGGRNTPRLAAATDNYGPQLKAISDKLDRLLTALGQTAPKAEAKPTAKVEAKPVAEEKPAKKEEKAKAEKKSAAAKAPADKPAKKAAKKAKK